MRSTLRAIWLLVPDPFSETNSLWPFQHNNQGTPIAVIVAVLHNRATRFHRMQLVQRCLSDAITADNDPEKLSRIPLMLCDG